jgi:hypothetical protein
MDGTLMGFSFLSQGYENKVNLPTALVSTGTDKQIPSVHHPSRMVLVHCGQCKDGGTVQQKMDDLAQKWKISETENPADKLNSLPIFLPGNSVLYNRGAMISLSWALSYYKIWQGFIIYALQSKLVGP